MPVRTVKLELEAKLQATKGGGIFSKPSGKLERKSYGDGTERLKISLRNLKVPDNSDAIVNADGQEIAKISITNKSGRLDQESQDISFMPTLQPGQIIEVRVCDRIFLKGTLHSD